MAVKWIHVIVVLIIMMLFLARQKCIAAATSGKRRVKRSSFDDPYLTVIPPISNAYSLGSQCSWLHFAWPRLQKIAIPKLKYKRDPIIIIDNEDIGRHPRGKLSTDHTTRIH